MMDSHSESYKKAGVDVTAGYEAVKKMRPFVESTNIEGVLTGIGGFGGLFQPNIAGMKEPVLVSGTDGVGTKLKIAFTLGKHDTIGIDCVAMCVNDVVCCGAKPLFFLDYLAVGKNDPERVAGIVSGVADGCRQAGCALIGGETAEMPGFYPEEEYDLAGFCVGMVDREKIIDGTKIAPGSVLIGVASSGVHSNGFSLVRKVFEGCDMKEYRPELGKTLGEALLAPTKIYVRPLLALMEEVEVQGVSHITGGGFYENIPRMFPAGIGAEIEKDSLEIPAIFQLIQKTGDIPERDMFNTFNMGTGLCIAVKAEDADRAVACLKANGEDARIIGRCVAGEGVKII